MSENTKPVPFIRVGKVQRAVKTPATMHSEMAKGEKPATTSLVGASAAPSHAPAARPHRTPSMCWGLADAMAAFLGDAMMAVLSVRGFVRVARKGVSVDRRDKKDAAGQNQCGDPELNISQNCAHHGRICCVLSGHPHPRFPRARPSLHGKDWGHDAALPITWNLSRRSYQWVKVVIEPCAGLRYSVT
jgi:hypothetical protein